MYRKITDPDFWKEMGKKWYINAYTVTLAAFLLWVSFFDSNNLVIQYKLQQTVEDLKTEKQYYREQLEVIRQTQRDMIENRERLAREKFYMHKADEDVFIIEDQGEQSE